MLIVDSQVHIWGADTPDRPWPKRAEAQRPIPLDHTDLLREMIVDKRPIRQIKEAARANGTRSLREAALALVKRGETTLAETRRVTQHA